MFSIFFLHFERVLFLVYESKKDQHKESGCLLVPLLARSSIQKRVSSE